MKTLYFHCFAGISGDMTLGALVDLGVDPAYLKEELKKLPMVDEFELEIFKAQKMGITGTKVEVVVKAVHEHHHHDEEGHSHEHGNDHVHKDHEHHGHEHHGDDHDHHGHDHHTHDHEGHEHPHSHDHEHSHSHEHRNLSRIMNLIDDSRLSNSVKKLSHKIFMEVAKAEAKVHGKDIDEVHFHEVGAVDSIVDIVGTAICMDYLKIDHVMASTVELGGGFVRCAHGLMPVPAPATAEILQDVPVHLGRVQSETTTPTGAAILKALVTEYQDDFNLKVSKIGYGLGTKEFKIPNVLRVYLAETEVAVTEKQIVVETNIDDMNPEWYGFIEEKLFAAGARDVYKHHIMMKKGRPAVQLNVLVEKSHLEKVEEILFNETTTLGLREYEVVKKVLERRFEKIETKFGSITVKIALRNGKIIKVKPEYDECLKVATEQGISLQEVYSELSSKIHQSITKEQ